MNIRFQRRIVSEQVGDVQADVTELTEYYEKCDIFRRKSTPVLNVQAIKSCKTSMRNHGLYT